MQQHIPVDALVARIRDPINPVDECTVAAVQHDYSEYFEQMPKIGGRRGEEKAVYNEICLRQSKDV